eukprot:sb/3479071/
MGAAVLLPALEERMELLNTLLPEQWDTLTPGKSLQLTLVLNSFLEDSQVTRLLGLSKSKEKRPPSATLMKLLLKMTASHTNSLLDGIEEETITSLG